MVKCQVGYVEERELESHHLETFIVKIQERIISGAKSNKGICDIY